MLRSHVAGSLLFVVSLLVIRDLLKVPSWAHYPLSDVLVETCAYPLLSGQPIFVIAELSVLCRSSSAAGISFAWVRIAMTSRGSVALFGVAVQRLLILTVANNLPRPAAKTVPAPTVSSSPGPL